MRFGELQALDIKESELDHGSQAIMSIRRSILEDGYALVDGINDTDAHMKLAGCLGKIQKNALGTFIHMLAVKDEFDARSRSLSAVYGRGAFPYHTDTASWVHPVRLMMLRLASGDVRRSTRIVKSQDLLEGISESALRGACWLVKNGSHSFYTTIPWFGRNADEMRYRLDLACMRPINPSARSLEPELKRRCSSEVGFPIAWQHGRVLVLDNWLMMHARSGAVLEEGERFLERIYLS